MIRLQKRAHHMGQRMICINPSKNTRRALQLMQLEEFFTIAPDIAAAEQLLRAPAPAGTVTMASPAGPGLAAIAWRGELSAANSEEVWRTTLDHLNARALLQQAITIDLSHLSFIDSTGLGVLIRARKHGARLGVKVLFRSANANVLNVIRLSRLEDYLLGSRP